MGQMSILGASVALLLLINTIEATVIPLRELHFTSDRYFESYEARATGEEYRLPLTVTPDLYTITLTPNYTDFATFNGEVLITVTATADANNISLHYDNITVHTTKVTAINGTELDLVSEIYNETTNIYTLRLRQQLTQGKRYTIYVNYTGHLLDDMAGFYRSSYTTADGKKR
jgi:aminopeptidase 2